MYFLRRPVNFVLVSKVIINLYAVDWLETLSDEQHRSWHDFVFPALYLH